MFFSFFWFLCSTKHPSHIACCFEVFFHFISKQNQRKTTQNQRTQFNFPFSIFLIVFLDSIKPLARANTIDENAAGKRRKYYLEVDLNAKVKPIKYEQLTIYDVLKKKTSRMYANKENVNDEIINLA